VTNIADYGAFVELEPGVEGLIHVSEMSWTKKNIHPGKIVSTSQQVDVQILEVDAQKRRISLGLKQTQDNPWEVFLASHPKGSQVEGPIRNITEFGLFIGLDGGVDGMVHLSDLDWNRSGDEAIKDYKKGDAVKAMVLDVDPQKERISLGIKQVGGDPLDTIGKLRKGSQVTCEVLAVHDNGIDVKLADTDITTFIKRSDLSLRAAAGALQCRRQGRCRRHQPRQAQSAHHRVDQGVGDCRREASGGAVRLLRLGGFAGRHLQGRHQKEGRR
jgi:small subunit ribosomal protein S1